MKFKRIVFLIISILVIGIAFVTSFDKQNYEQEDDFEDMYEVMLAESQVKVNDYIDVNNAVYQSQLVGEKPQIRKLDLTFDSENGGVDLSEQQKIDMINAVKNVFNDMTDEEYEAFVSLGDENPEIAQLVEILNGNEPEEDDLVETAALAIAGALYGAGLSNAAVITFESAVVALKAAKYAIIPYLQAALVVAALILLTVVIVTYWAQIKAIINTIIDFFVSTLSKVANLIRSTFNSMISTAKAAEAETLTGLGNVIGGNTDVGKQLRDLGMTAEELAKYLAIMLGYATWAEVLESIKNGDKDKVLCVGRFSPSDIAERFRYNVIAEAGNHFAFYNPNFEEFVNNVLGKRFGFSKKDIAFTAINMALIQYCCFDNWKFILCTNPFPYVAQSIGHPYHYTNYRSGGAGYAAELAQIQLNGYGNISGGVTWNSFPRVKNLFAPTNYTVSRSTGSGPAIA